MAQTNTPISRNEEIRIMPVAPTPEAQSIILVIALPKNGTMFSCGQNVYVQFRIDGYSLGAGSQFPRENEVAVSDLGQSVHVIIDNKPYFPVVEPALDPFNEGGYFYDMSYKFPIPFGLEHGLHTIRMFPARSFGESLKTSNTFAIGYFYVGDEQDNINVDFNKPFLTYNEPSDNMPLTEGQPILLDFFISNCELTKDGYKVRLSIDGKGTRTLTSWQPYYIYGLKRGRHKVKLELLDPDDKVVPGTFNRVERTINVQ
jgi:hypothetical protein